MRYQSKKLQDKYLETSLLNEFKLYVDGNTKVGSEFQSIPEKEMND